MGITLLSVAAALSLGTGHIAGADALTGRSISADYVSGALDPRLEEIGTNAQTKAKEPEWKSRQNGGLLRHCTKYHEFFGIDSSPCDSAFNRNGQ